MAYRFVAYVRVDAITTDSGPRFQILDASNSSRLRLLTGSLTRTAMWVPQVLEFQTGPETQLLLIRVVRGPSRKINNQISGNAWIDRVSLALSNDPT